MFLRNIFAFLRACFIAGRRAKNKTEPQPLNNPAEIGLRNFCRALGVWNAEIQARTPMLSPSTLRSRRAARPAVLLLRRKFYTGRFIAGTVRTIIHDMTRTDGGTCKLNKLIAVVRCSLGGAHRRRAH